MNLRKLDKRKTLGKRSATSLSQQSIQACTKKREIKLKIKGKKNPLLVAVRREQLQNTVNCLKEHKKDLVTVQEINEKLFQHFEEVPKLILDPIDSEFCDGLLVPKTKLT